VVPGAAFLLKDLSVEKRKLVDPGLLDAAEQGKKLSMLGILEAQQKRGALART